MSLLPLSQRTVCKADPINDTVVLARPGPARRAGGRDGALETRSRRVPVVIGGEVVSCGERFRAFRELPDMKQDRQQVDVGEGEAIADEITGRGDRLVENPDLLA